MNYTYPCIPKRFKKMLRVQFLENYAGPDTFEPAHEGDAGIDLYAAEDHFLYPGERHLIKCGIRIALPPGTEGQIRPKSGLAYKQGLTVINTPGTIDEGYRGEIMVAAFNANPVITTEELNRYRWRSTDDLHHVDPGTRMIAIDKGQKIAQLVITKYERPAVEIVEDLDDTVRGDGGFGSTGV